MKIKRILHPEIVLDKRGDPHLRAWLRETLDSMDLNPSTGMLGMSSDKILNSLAQRIQPISEMVPLNDALTEFFLSNPNIQVSKRWKDGEFVKMKIDFTKREWDFLKHEFFESKVARRYVETVATLWYFKSQKAPTYVLTKNVANQLAHCVGKVPLDLVPTDFMAYVAMPDDTQYPPQPERQWDGFYASFAENGLLILSLVTKEKDRAGRKGQYMVSQINASPSKLQEILDEKNLDDPKDLVIRLIANVLVFIHSPSSYQLILPDTLYKPRSEKKRDIPERPEDLKPIAENLTTIPVTVLDLRYAKKGNAPGVASSHRRAFWRWQRTGPGRTIPRQTYVRETNPKYYIVRFDCPECGHAGPHLATSDERSHYECDGCKHVVSASYVKKSREEKLGGRERG